MVLKSQNSAPESTAATGNVKTHARAISRRVDTCSPLLSPAIVPATPDDSTCVVLTGNPYPPAARIVTIAISSADSPCAYVRCVLPIFSPTVTTMRFQPIIVPNPSASATATFTHVGINFVDLSRNPL